MNVRNAWHPFLGFLLRIARTAAAVALFLYMGLLFFRPVETGDVWWHLKAGQYIFTHHRVPTADPFPFGAEASPWILTQWLGSLILFIVDRFSGIAGLQIFRAAVFLTVALVFFVYARRRAGGGAAVLLTLLLAQALSLRLFLRPFVFNFLFIEIYLISFLAYQRRPRAGYLLAVAASNLVWVNVHLGSFMYGLPIAGTFLIGAGLEAFRDRTPDSRRKLRHLGILWAVLLVSPLLNPYGLEGALHPFRALMDPGYINFQELRETIAELRPPPLFSISVFWWFYALFLLGGGAIYAASRDRIIKLVLFGLGAGMFMAGLRGCVFFALAAGFVVAETLGENDVRNRLDGLPGVLWAEAGFLVLAFGLCWSPVTTWLKTYTVDNGKVYPYLSFREDRYSPRETLAFMARHRIEGPVFNDDRYGGYLLWHGYPRLRPFIDSRQIHYENFRFTYGVRRDPAVNWPALQKMFQFRAVLLDASRPVNETMLEYFRASKAWKPVFVEGCAVLFVPRDSLPRDLRVRFPGGGPDLPDEKTLLRRAKNVLMTASSKKDRVLTYSYVEPEVSGATLFYLGNKAEGLRLVLNAYGATRDPMIKRTLGILTAVSLQQNAPGR